MSMAEGQFPDLLPAREDANGCLQGRGPPGAGTKEERVPWVPKGGYCEVVKVVGGLLGLVDST